MKSFALLGAILLAACSRPAPPPRLESVEPSMVSAREDTVIGLTGSAFDYATLGDLDHPELSEFQLSLSVRLVGPITVSLPDAERVDRTMVNARVPAGLPLGKYTVELRTALGTAQLIDALEVADCEGDCVPVNPDGGCTVGARER